MEPTTLKIQCCGLLTELRGLCRDLGHDFCIHNGGNTGEKKGVFNEYLAFTLDRLFYDFLGNAYNLFLVLDNTVSNRYNMNGRNVWDS